ncbi:MAG: M20 family metallopeptidase [Ruminococcaceae bacterium]|nr:M20 family metallopeptidase [Oscillospiraceae bacterium]
MNYEFKESALPILFGLWDDFYMEIMKKAFDFIDSNKERFLSFWEDICNIEGVAEDKAALDSVADRIEKFASEELGVFTERIPMEKCGDFLIIDTRHNSEKGICFLAHMDTVHKKGAFGSPAVKRDGNKLIGPGVIDCKGGIAIALLAMMALIECGYEKNARLILTSDEEISNRLGGEEEIRIIGLASQGFKAAFNCEVARENEIVVSRKGILRYRFEIQGIAAHAGIDYFGGASAIREAARKIIALEEQSTEGGTTYNCGIIKGGELSNIVPEKCEFVVDVRVKDKNEMALAEQKLKKIAEKQFVKGTETKLCFISRREPMIRNSETEMLFEHLNRVSKKYGLGELTAVESGGGSDSAYTQLANVPSICAVGATGDYCHTVREYADISSLTTRAKLLTVAALEL